MGFFRKLTLDNLIEIVMDNLIEIVKDMSGLLGDRGFRLQEYLWNSTSINCRRKGCPQHQASGNWTILQLDQLIFHNSKLSH